MNLSEVPTTLSIPGLRAAIKGRVIAPDDADYDEARTRRWAASTAGRPSSSGSPTPTTSRASIALRPRRPACRSPSAAAATAPPATASSTAASSSTSRDMNGARDRRRRADGLGRDRPDGRRVHRRRSEPTASRPGSATRARSGIGGITLGGGIGYLVRKHGLTIDDLLAAEIVTADGQLLRVDADRTPTCSGRSAAAAATSGSRPGSSSGSTTSATFVGGMLILPATAETVAGLHRRGRGGARGALDDRQRHALPADAVRARGAPRTGSSSWRMLAYAGRAEAGERAMAPFRALATPIADMVQPMPYPEIYPPEDARLPPDRRRADAVHRPRRPRRRRDDRRAAGGVRRVHAGRPAPRARRRDGAGPGRRHGLRPPAEPDHGQRGRLLRRARRPRPSARPGSPTSRRRCDQGDPGAYVNFLATKARRGSGPPTRARPGTGWPRSRPATTRPTCSALQPEHPAGELEPVAPRPWNRRLTAS